MILIHYVILFVILLQTRPLCFAVFKPSACAFRTYDYIVIGSGAAGSVVAYRISSNPNITVLLLEAGSLPLFHSEIPFLAPFQHLTRQNWGYHMEKQPNFGLGLVDGLMPWSRGKVLGGSSIINSMLYVRGNPADYDRWAAAGNPGWSYDEVLPYFKKSENASIKFGDSDYHGIYGPLNVEDVPYRTGTAKMFVKGFKEMGYPYVDYNGKNQMGVSFVQANLRKGRRCSAEKAFLHPARSRSNLYICLNSRVSKILINARKNAYGAEYIGERKKLKAFAAREVIVSAGTFHSPQILMLSGIGPENHLTELGISVIQNLPVGQKLYDHLTFLGLIFTVNKPIGFNFFETLMPSALLKFLLNGDGILTLPSGVEAFSYFKTSAANYSANYPDIEFLFTGGSLQSDYDIFFKSTFGVSQVMYDGFWKNLESKHVWSVLPILFHPKSYGSIKLRSTNPLDAPLLFGNYLTDPDNNDLRTFLSAVRELQRIINASVFKIYNNEQIKTPLPGCEHLEFDSDHYWECVIRSVPSTMNHQTSTCKMGPPNDSEAVVDHKLRVYGVKNLRVIDTSVFPVTLSAHTNAPAYMVGEKGADLVLDDYNRPL